MDSNKIDYTEKIRTFQAIVDNYNEEIALNYLTKANWDETKAAQLFFNDTTNIPGRNMDMANTGNIDSSHHYVEDINQDRVQRNQRASYQNNFNQSDNNDINANLLGRRSHRAQPVQPTQEGFFKRWVVNPINYIGSIFCSRRGDQPSEEENQIFSRLPEKVNNLNSFTTMIKTRIGILVLYQNTDYDFFNELINQVVREEHLMDLLKVNYVIYPVLVSSTEGQRIVSLLSEHLLYPAIVFSLNRRENNNFNRNSVIDRLEGNFSLDVFKDALFRNLEVKERMGQGKPHSDRASLIAQQKEEIENLERMENEKKKVEEERIRKEKLEKEEKIKREQEILNKKIEKEKQLPEEPAQGDPNSTHIIFRYPDGARRKERRFLKTDTVKILYDFIDSLGPDVFEESDKYELIQPFPFKLYNNLDRTLEAEQLFPNAVLQIREI